MPPHLRDNHTRVVKFVQELIADLAPRPAVTPALIAEHLERVLAMSPQWALGLDRATVTDELIRRFSVWVGEDSVLKSDLGHEAWLTAERRRGWAYWQRYRELIETAQSLEAADATDRSTNTILGLLEDPKREGAWDRRGLVVGHVQAGKTSNYIGLICKAADAGYKVIIVLAGLHNSLRTQTQIRLDEGFLGYQTSPQNGHAQAVGVGLLNADPTIRPNAATNRTESGDFTSAFARQFNISPDQRPWLLVVKKNKTVLELIHKWLTQRVADAHDPHTGRRLVTHLPLLLIDDEADHASVDTGEEVLGSDGEPNLEHAPTRINSCIRRLLNTFTRKAYVGYTATPFANIFIHERAQTLDEGPDLFPSAFIINLATSNAYVGASQMFGVRTAEGRHGGLPLTRVITDQSGDSPSDTWMPARHKSSHFPRFLGTDEPPPSLIEAIDAFLIACAIRRARGQGHEHMSMLVHVTRFNAVQAHVHRQVESHLRAIQQRLSRSMDHKALDRRLHSLWERDFLPTSAAVAELRPNDAPDNGLDWETVRLHLPDAAADIAVLRINGSAKEALDYDAYRRTGLKVIAIGGDKLSRGLTLEGLCVSYFLRASRMYDTLMQMGRWFGYRSGYLDLCRLYTTPDLLEWFGHISEASDELREEFDLMTASGGSPRDYGLKVQSHPVLLVTSPLKMRTAKSLLLSFSSQCVQTVAFSSERMILAANLRAAHQLIASIGQPHEGPRVVRNWGSAREEWEALLWGDVPADSVIGFLESYHTHPDAYKVNSALLTDFIRQMTGTGELRRWTVAAIGGGSGQSLSIGSGLQLSMLKRSGATSGNKCSISTLRSPRDEAIDLTQAQWAAALALTKLGWRPDGGRSRSPKQQPDAPSGEAIRQVRGHGQSGTGVVAEPDRGLLLLYFVDPRPEWTGLKEHSPAISAFAISFPGSSSGVKVEYKANHILWEQQYGTAE